MKIYIIRHGETLSNELGRFQGWTDDPLNDNGILLAEITGKKMKGIKFDIAYSSPLIRAYKTAEIILQKSENISVQIVKDCRLKEISMGDWELKKFRGVESEVNMAESKRFLTKPSFLQKRPGGETIEEVCRRTQNFLHELSKKNFSNVLVSTHGGALRAMLNFLYDDPTDFWQGHIPFNCFFSIVEVNSGSIKLIADNQVLYDHNLCIDRYSN